MHQTAAEFLKEKIGGIGVTQNVVENARLYDGTPPVEWELLGMRQNQHCRFRYYRDRQGANWYTVQRLKRDHMRIALYEKEGLAYAKKEYTGPRRARRKA